MNTDKVLQHDFTVGSIKDFGPLLPNVADQRLTGVVMKVEGEWIDTEVTLTMAYQGVDMGLAIISPSTIYENKAQSWGWVWA
jgi:hypothetical protein